MKSKSSRRCITTEDARISAESRGSNGEPRRSFRLFSSRLLLFVFLAGVARHFPIRVRLDVKISTRSVYFRRDGVSGKMWEAGEVEGWRKRKTRWWVRGMRGKPGGDAGSAERGGTSRAQAILRTTQPLGGRTNCVGAQSRATRVEEGGKRLHNYPIQRTYPNPPFSRSLSSCALASSPIGPDSND